LRSLGTTTVHVIGGVTAVSDGVVSALHADRVAGADRFATAAAVAALAGPPDTVVVASGDDAHLVDALAGGALAKPVLLTAVTELPASTSAALAADRSTAVQAFVLGGSTAVDDSTLGDVAFAFNG
jgi:hypothetical protein